MRAALFGSAVGAFLHSYCPAASSTSTTTTMPDMTMMQNNTDESSSSSSLFFNTSNNAFPTAQCALVDLQPLPAAIDPKEFRSFPLVNSYDESPDTKVLRLAFPDGMMQAGLTLTSFVLLRYKDADGNDVIRPYTPISRLDQRGYMEIMVKCYKGSKMGTHLHTMKLGSTVEVKGPFAKLPYKPGMYKSIGMLAAGTGITPMFQIFREALKEKSPPEISMIYCNKRKEDILLGSEISELYELHQHFAPYFVLEDPPRDWAGGVGFVTKDMIANIMPPPNRAHDSVICVCGPPGFMKHVSGEKDFTKSPPTQGDLTGLLKDCGYSARMVYKF